MYKRQLSNIKTAYEEHGGGISGVAAAAMEAVKGWYTAGYTFIDLSLIHICSFVSAVPVTQDLRRTYLRQRPVQFAAPGCSFTHRPRTAPSSAALSVAL